MPVELLICDCDGVLVDSEVLACAVDSAELVNRGFRDYSLETVLLRYAGMSQRDMIASIERETGAELGKDFADAVERGVYEAIRTKLQPLPDAAKVIGGIDARKCVASSSNPTKLDLALTVTGLKEFFDPNIFSSVLVENGKPAPDLFLYAAAKMGKVPEECCVIEDSLAGVTAALAAGMKVIGFVGGSHCRPDHSDRLKALGAEIVVESWTDIPKVLESLS